jgi:hypothetical protein
MAATICRYCGDPIGYETGFINDRGLVHITCLETAIREDDGSIW